ncbi:hypothetical protein ACFL1A_03470, partial [Patescibacteria group bacterium]
ITFTDALIIILLVSLSTNNYNPYFSFWITGLYMVAIYIYTEIATKLIRNRVPLKKIVPGAVLYVVVAAISFYLNKDLTMIAMLVAYSKLKNIILYYYLCFTSGYTEIKRIYKHHQIKKWIDKWVLRIYWSAPVTSAISAGMVALFFWWTSVWQTWIFSGVFIYSLIIQILPLDSKQAV